MAVVDLLERNKVWAQEQLQKDPKFFSRHTGGQKPRVLWIGCADSRVPAEQVVGCGPGELFIHRNVANVVAYNDVNIAAVVQYAVEHLQVPDIVVCGHYGCGGVAAACSHKIVDGYIGDWLMITSWAQRWVDERLGATKDTMDREEYLRHVVDENVKLQVKHLTHLSMVKKAWEANPGTPRVHGWVYDIGTGLIRVVVDGATAEAKDA